MKGGMAGIQSIHVFDYAKSPARADMGIAVLEDQFNIHHLQTLAA